MFLRRSFESKMNFIKEQPKSVALNLQLSVITHKYENGVLYKLVNYIITYINSLI